MGETVDWAAVHRETRASEFDRALDYHFCESATHFPGTLPAPTGERIERCRIMSRKTEP